MIDTLKARHSDLWQQMHHWFLNQPMSQQLGETYVEGLFAAAASLELTTCLKPMVLGVSGAQGSGKSTFAKLLGTFLSDEYQLRCEVMSLDDFYLTRAERLELGQSVHPMLATRGVPGTHDVELLSSVKEGLLAGETVRIPEFNKGEDDRAGYREVDGSERDVLIFEGWCWGALPLFPDDLQAPVNELEAKEDSEGKWRQYVAAELFNYQEVFDTDGLVYLKVPGMESVLEWRWQQEQQITSGSQKMSQAEVARFIMFYERITRHMLSTMPGAADVLIELAKDHSFASISVAD